MATITTLSKVGTTHMSALGATRGPRLIEFELNFASALTAKGSALAAADVVECISIPPGSKVLDAGASVKVAADSTTLTVGVGYGGATSRWAAAFDAKGAVGTYSTDVAGGLGLTFASADTVDVIFTTLTGTLATGKLRVWALVMDISDINTPGAIVQRGD